jgi:hypothetical protein
MAEAVIAKRKVSSHSTSPHIQEDISGTPPVTSCTECRTASLAIALTEEGRVKSTNPSSNVEGNRLTTPTLNANQLSLNLSDDNMV